MNKNLHLIFSGTFSSAPSSARLLNIKSVLEQEAGIHVHLISQFTSADHISNESNVRYLATNTTLIGTVINRIVKGISGHIRLLKFIYDLPRHSLLYFYCPSIITTLPGQLLAYRLGHKVLVDKTELHQAEKSSVLFRWSDNLSIKYAHKVLVISERLKSYAERNQDKEVHLLPIMVNSKRFSIPEVRANPFQLGYIGTFGDKDGVRLMLEAIQLVKKEIPQIVLSLIGKNLHYPSILEDIDNLGLTKNVVLSGELDYEDIPKHLLKCDCFIMNRTNSRYASYGYPIKLGEYFACNRPVLMSDGQGFSENFEHGKEVIKYRVDSPNSLAEAILWRYENQENAIQISQRGYEYALRIFDHHKVCNHLVCILESI